MAYMRGEYYVYNSDTHVHIWAAEGYDEWDESGWAANHGGKRASGKASGVALPLEKFDELVMMRLAEMLDEGDGVVEQAIDRALELYGGANACRPLAQSAASLKKVLQHVGFDRSISPSTWHPAPAVPPPHVDMLMRMYEAFNARDIDALLSFMHPEINWPQDDWNTERLRGHAELREHWLREWGTMEERMEPTGFETGSIGRTVVNVRKLIRMVDRTDISERIVEHTFAFEEGLIRTMKSREIW